MSWNWSRKFAYVLKLTYSGHDLEVVHQTKLLGVVVDTSGRWNAHIDYITAKAKRRAYLIQRLKRLGASDDTLKLIYVLFVRSILEFAAPLWTGAVTQNKKLTMQLQRVQNYICRIIRPDLAPAETEAMLKLCSLEGRRINATHKFAKGMGEMPILTLNLQKVYAKCQF